MICSSVLLTSGKMRNEIVLRIRIFLPRVFFTTDHGCLCIDGIFLHKMSFDSSICFSNFFSFWRAIMTPRIGVIRVFAFGRFCFCKRNRNYRYSIREDNQKYFSSFLMKFLITHHKRQNENIEIEEYNAQRFIIHKALNKFVLI